MSGLKMYSSVAMFYLTTYEVDPIVWTEFGNTFICPPKEDILVTCSPEIGIIGIKLELAGSF